MSAHSVMIDKPFKIIVFTGHSAGSETVVDDNTRYKCRTKTYAGVGA